MLKKIICIPKLVRAILILAIVLATIRVFVFKTTTFNYIYWNLFLAFIPFVISSVILYFSDIFKINKNLVILGLILWLLFLPNALYIITDFIHLGRIRNVPVLFDTVLIFSSAFSGIVLGFYSIFQIEEVLNKFYSKYFVTITMAFSILFASFGVYLGRFLRFDSWDVFTNVNFLFKNIKNILFQPLINREAYLYTLLFFVFFYVLYITFKQIKFK